MRFKFSTYEGFMNYCLGICKNKEYIVTETEKNNLIEFENVVNLIYELVKSNVLNLYNDVFNSVIEQFKYDPEKALNAVEYINKKIDKVYNGEINFYYFITSIKTLLNIKLQYTNEYLNTKSQDIYYPERLKCFVLGIDVARIYTLDSLDRKELNHYGVYFIYDDKNELKYVGKSTNCVIVRSFQSAKERKLLNFSKIEYRYPKSKSDVAVYESYYISKYKPEKNSDMVYEDELTIILPELDVDYCINRNEKKYIEESFYYYKESVLDIDEYYDNPNVLLLNEQNKLLLDKKGIKTKSEAFNSAYENCITMAKNNDLIILNETI